MYSDIVVTKHLAEATKKEGLILAYSLRERSIRVGCHGSRSGKQQVTCIFSQEAKGVED